MNEEKAREMSKRQASFGERVEAANNLKCRAIKQKVKKKDVANEKKLWSIGFWYGYVEALKDTKGDLR